MARIINFEEATKGIATSLSIAPVKHKPWSCGHGNFELFPHTREVRCKHCGELIDPFDALVEYAQNERRFIWQIRENKAAIREFEKIQSEWSLTTREKRRIARAKQEARFHGSQTDEHNE